MKFRKIGASLLAAAMLVGSCLTASAAEVPPETCTVEYKEQSKNITVTSSWKDDIIVLDFVIGQGASGDQLLSLGDAVVAVMSDRIYMPGDTQRIEISVTNNSGRSFNYKDNSFILSTMDTSNFGTLENGTLLPVLGCDGQYVATRFAGSMLPQYFSELFGGKTPDFEMMCGIYETLAENGYTGENAVTDYMVHYFNKKYNLSCTSLAEVIEKKGDAIISALMGNNGIFHVTEDELEKMEEQHPWIKPLLFVSGTSGNLTAQIKWPEGELAAASYNAFYQSLYAAAFGEENIARLNPKASYDEFFDSHCIADYIPGSTAYTEANTYMRDVFASSGIGNGETVSFTVAFAVNAPRMGNAYADYDIGHYNVIELEQTDGDVTVSKVDPDGNAVNGAEFVVGRVVDGETQYLGYEGEWTADQQAAATFISENGSFTVEKLPFGDYFLQEIAAPDGYVLLDETVPFTVDEITETVEVVNQLEEEEIPDESTPLTPPGEDGSTPSDDTEEIPDESNPLAPATGEASSSPVWFAVGMILAGCCVCALAVCRRKEARKQK